MSVYDVLLFLHVVGGFAAMAAAVISLALLVAARRGDDPDVAAVLLRLTRPRDVLFLVGGALTLVLGVWLAVYVDGYELWDGWILAALVLWAVAAETGRRGGRADAHAREAALHRGGGTDGAATAGGDAGARDTRAALVHLVYAASVVAILALMIFKPGGA